MQWSAKIGIFYHPFRGKKMSRELYQAMNNFHEEFVKFPSFEYFNMVQKWLLDKSIAYYVIWTKVCY